MCKKISKFSYFDGNKVSRCIIAILHPKIICSPPAVEQKAVRPIVTDKAVPFVHFKAGDFDALPLYQLMLEMEHECKGNEFLITKYFFEIWDIIMRRFTDAYRLHVHGMEESSGHDARLNAMMLFIDGHYRERISLGDIAASGGSFFELPQCSVLCSRCVYCCAVGMFTTVQSVCLLLCSRCV